MIAVGLDTSNYTTSIAYFDGEAGENCSRLLPVGQGELGLRQSDAVFHHTRCLPELSDRLFSDLHGEKIRAVGISTQPRAVEGSYMPCFLVGISHGTMLSQALRVPLFPFSHQQGHIAAAAWSSGHMELLDMPHLAWHLSGGTTELLLVQPEGRGVGCRRIGGTSDISAGQLIDRTGKLLGLPFPAGKSLDELARGSAGKDCFRVRVLGGQFSLSGLENKVRDYCAHTNDPAETAAYAMRSVCHAVAQATIQAREEYSGLPVIFSGGVSSNSMLRCFPELDSAYFAEPRFSTDNAMGIAILAHRFIGG